MIAGIGATLAAIPFFRSLGPQQHQEPSYGEVGIGKLLPGDMTIIQFEGRVYYVVRRTEAQIRILEKENDKLLDGGSNSSEQPAYAKNLYRSRNPQLFVVEGRCTHSGCAPAYRPQAEPTAFDPDWQGGFYCPCHGAKFDLAGRVYKGQPAPTNMVIPDHEVIDENTIRLFQSDAI